MNLDCKNYEEDEFLMLSGIQHFAFCRRQWALIHLEQQWDENYHTIDGEIFHERTHDESLKETRKDIIITRGLRVFSRSLGLAGNCDVVEYHKNKKGIAIQGHEGRYIPYPIEYKRGKPKSDDRDEVQVCAQAICLEEMLLCTINEGALFYGETKHRVVVEFNDELRSKVRNYAKEMHDLYDKKHTPIVKKNKKCLTCSLSDLCMNTIFKAPTVDSYFDSFLKGENGK